MPTADVKIEEDMENQIVKLFSPKTKDALLVRKTTGSLPFFEVVWPNDKRPVEGTFTSQSRALEAALHFLSHMKVTRTVERDNKTKAREQRKADKQNATESTS